METRSKARERRAKERIGVKDQYGNICLQAGDENNPKLIPVVLLLKEFLKPSKGEKPLSPEVEQRIRESIRKHGLKH